MVSARKRFYANVSVVHGNDANEFEICLDQRKLKTPLMKPFKVNNETVRRSFFFLSHVTLKLLFPVSSPTPSPMSGLARRI